MYLQFYSLFCTLAINQVTLLGRVGAEPQKRGNEEHPLVIFSVATHVNYKNPSGKFRIRRSFIDCLIYNFVLIFDFLIHKFLIICRYMLIVIAF